MKKSLILAGLLAIGTSALAYDVKGYVGAGVGIISNKGTATFTDGVETISDSGRDSSTLGILKGGVILDNNHRTSLIYAPVFDSYFSAHNFLLAYDYLIPVNSESRVALGIHAGAITSKGKKEVDFLKYNGLSYGIQAGYIYDITSNVEFEIGAMYTKYNLKDTGTIDGVSYEAKLKDTASAFVGINYKF